MVIPSNGRPVVRDEPGRANFLFSNSVLWKTEQKDQQEEEEEEAIYFHDVIFMIIKQRTQSNILTSKDTTLPYSNNNYTFFTDNVFGCYVKLGICRILC